MYVREQAVFFHGFRKFSEILPQRHNFLLTVIYCLERQETEAQQWIKAHSSSSTNSSTIPPWHRRSCNRSTGKGLMQMLTAQDGGAALNRAAQSAAAGNTKELAAMLSGLMKSPDGMAFMNRINDSAKK